MMEVRRVTRKECEPFVLGIHYAKRWPSISFAFGLFVGGALEGVCTFGKPAGSTVRTGLMGPDLQAHVLELNRLCLRNNRKNEASFLVSKAVKALEGDWAIISYADTEQGHKGVVYQASNFLYLGLSAKRTDWAVKGREGKHGQTISDEFRGVPNRASAMRAKYGDDFYLSPRPRKHRYVRIVGSRRFRKQATSALRYEKKEYPK